jgi:5-methyltetrahydrofolate--homocysteine methyltransferase
MGGYLVADLEKIMNDIIAGNEETAASSTRAALVSGVEAREVLSKALIPAMEEVGRRMETQEYFLPEVIVAARAMQDCLVLLRPELAVSDEPSRGFVLLGTVQGDLHDIGKNLVRMMLEGAGFTVRDLGIDVPSERFIKEVRETRPQILGLSALLSTTIPEMANVISELEEAGLREQVKVIVGGAPLTQQYADRIGADSYAKDAAEAVVMVKRLLVGT